MKGSRSILVRLARLIVTFFLVTFATAMMINLVPGDPAAYMAGEGATPEQIQIVNKQYGFQRNAFVRYGDWLSHAVRGDLGRSYVSSESVTGSIQRRLPVTLEIAVLSVVIALLVAVPLAMASASRAGKRFDRIVGAGTSAMISTPAFVFGLLFIYFLSIKLNLLPANGWVPLTRSPFQNFRSVILPVACISLGEIVVLHRVLRAELVTTLQQDYILLARAKGLSRRAIMWKHALRPSSFSLLTLSALQLARILGATVIVESIFVLPGLGTMLFQGIASKDLGVVQGVVSFIAIVFLAVNFVVDLLYGVIDPRTRVRA